MTQNRIVIYSNGMADFRRSYTATRGSETRISIPVRKDHIADVLASLNLYGPVTLSSPPSFRPANEAEGTLTIDAKRVIDDLAVKLSGAQVQVDRPGESLTGVLVGTHAEAEFKGEEKAFPRSLVVLTASGLARVPIRDVQRLQFLDSAVQAEIDKALRRNFEQIKPHSTFVELAVATDQEQAEFVLQYTVPAAAWKISYRLRLSDDGHEFQGFAIVDNNTEEDWNDFWIAVVTGEPLTFSTDLADSKTPRRRHVNVVNDTAAAGVELAAEEPVYSMAPAAGGMAESRKMAKRAPSLLERGGANAPMDFMKLPSARLAEADVREVGDSCIFSSATPVSIGSNRSAVIPVFQTTLEKTRRVLHYCHDHHPERTYRVVEFTNETAHPLGRGVCTFYEDGAYAGSSLLPALVAGGEALLAHALESGLKVRRDVRPRRTRLVGLRLGDGACQTVEHHRQQTSYRIKNSKDEAFELLLDHGQQLREPQFACILAAESEKQTLQPRETLPLGIRLAFTVPPRSHLLLTVDETQTVTSTVALVNLASETDRMSWLVEHVIATDGPLAHDRGVQQALAIQQRIDDQQRQIADAQAQVERLTKRQERLRKNIAAGSQDQQSAQWKIELGKAEDQLTTIEEETLPRLQAAVRAIQAELRQHLAQLAAAWQEPGSVD